MIIRRIGILLVAGLLLVTGCSAAADRLPEEAEAQAAAVAATAQAAASEAGRLAATAAAVAEERSAPVVATARALDPGSLELTADELAHSLDNLRQQFASVVLAANQQQTITITDAQINAAIAARQEGLGLPVPLFSPRINFSDGLILVAGELNEPVTGTLLVTFTATVVDGALRFDVVSARLGDIQVPAALLGTAEAVLNLTIGEAIAQLPAGVQVQAVTISNGMMNIVVGRQG